MDKGKGKVNFILKEGINMKVNIKMIKEMVGVQYILKMVIHMLENIKIVKGMVMERIILLMGINMKVFLKMGKSLGRAKCTIRMEELKILKIDFIYKTM